jgi:hypothetical protein
MNLIKFFFIFFAILACATFGSFASAWGGERQWLVLVYANGINDRGLQGFGKDMINQLETFGSSDEVTVVVKYAALSKGGQSELQFPRDVKTYLIQKDQHRPEINSPVIDTSPQTNMAAPSSLMTFIRQNLLKYPAKKIALILWGKGEGFKGWSHDDVSRTKMSVRDLAQTLVKTKEILGKKIDVVAADADFMQMAEVLYELKDHAQIIVGVESRVSNPAFYYDMMLQDVLDDPGMSAETFAKTMLASSENPIASAVRTSEMQAFTERLNQWVAALMSEPAAMKAAAAMAAQTSSCNMQNTKDLCDYIDRIAQGLPADSPAAATGVKLKSHIQKNLLLAYAVSNFDPQTKKIAPQSYQEHCHGLAVYLPDLIYEANAYEPLAFAADTSWRKFLFKILEEKLKQK